MAARTANVVVLVAGAIAHDYQPHWAWYEQGVWQEAEWEVEAAEAVGGAAEVAREAAESAVDAAYSVATLWPSSLSRLQVAKLFARSQVIRRQLAAGKRIRRRKR